MRNKLDVDSFVRGFHCLFKISLIGSLFTILYEMIIELTPQLEFGAPPGDIRERADHVGHTGRNGS